MFPEINILSAFWGILIKTFKIIISEQIHILFWNKALLYFIYFNSYFYLLVWIHLHQTFGKPFFLGGGGNLKKKKHMFSVWITVYFYIVMHNLLHATYFKYILKLRMNRKRPQETDLKGSLCSIKHLLYETWIPIMLFICLFHFFHLCHSIEQWHVLFPTMLLMFSLLSSSLVMMTKWVTVSVFRKVHFAFLFIRENVRTFTLPFPLITCFLFLAYARCLSNIAIRAWINTSTLSFYNACKQSKPFTLCLSPIIDFYFYSESP